jgi:hypothetical protein
MGRKNGTNGIDEDRFKKICLFLELYGFRFVIMIEITRRNYNEYFTITETETSV